MQRLLALFLFLFLLVPGPVLAESPARNDGATDPASRAARSSLFAGFNAGIGGSGTTNEYKGMSSDGTFLPLIGYEGEHLYLRGVSGGLHLFRNELVRVQRAALLPSPALLRWQQRQLGHAPP